jgi:hypothetical protein
MFSMYFPRRNVTKSLCVLAEFPRRHVSALSVETFELVSTAIQYSPVLKEDDEDLVLGDLSKVEGLLSRFDSSVTRFDSSVDAVSVTLVLFLEDYMTQSDKGSTAVSALWFCLESMALLAPVGLVLS